MRIELIYFMYVFVSVYVFSKNIQCTSINRLLIIFNYNNNQIEVDIV